MELVGIDRHTPAGLFEGKYYVVIKTKITMIMILVEISLCTAVVLQAKLRRTEN